MSSHINQVSCDDIDLAYPTQTFYDNRVEGKPGARAPIDLSTISGAGR